MKRIKVSLLLCLAAYLIANIIGFATYYVHVSLMWIAMFTVNPVVFGFFFYACLKRTGCTPQYAFTITNRIIWQWIAFCFLLDAGVYMWMVPFFSYYKPNLTFFIDQSPWIWLNYLSLFIPGHVSRIIYVKNYL
jgi:hypothetical protein